MVRQKGEEKKLLKGVRNEGLTDDENWENLFFTVE